MQSVKTVLVNFSIRLVIINSIIIYAVTYMNSVCSWQKENTREKESGRGGREDQSRERGKRGDRDKGAICCSLAALSSPAPRSIGSGFRIKDTFFHTQAPEHKPTSLGA